MLGSLPGQRLCGMRNDDQGLQSDERRLGRVLTLAQVLTAHSMRFFRVGDSMPGACTALWGRYFPILVSWEQGPMLVVLFPR